MVLISSPARNWVTHTHTHRSSLKTFSSKFQSWFNRISTHLPLFIINLPLIVEAPYESSLERDQPQQLFDHSNLMQDRINECERPLSFFFFFFQGVWPCFEREVEECRLWSRWNSSSSRNILCRRRLWLHSWGCHTVRVCELSLCSVNWSTHWETQATQRPIGNQWSYRLNCYYY